MGWGEAGHTADWVTREVVCEEVTSVQRPDEASEPDWDLSGGECARQYHHLTPEGAGVLRVAAGGQCGWRVVGRRTAQG